VENTDANAVGRAPCERRGCGKPARVLVLVGYDGPKPLRRHLCLRCAETAFEDYLVEPNGAPRSRLSVASLLIAGGILVAAVGATADEWGVQGSSGFGWKQQSALAVGGLLVVLGGLLRADVVAVVGTVLFGLGALADLFGTFGSPGMGWRQMLLIFAGLVSMCWGLLLRAYLSRQPTKRA